MIVSPLYFNPDAHPVWEAMLLTWLRYYADSGNPYEIVLTTDSKTHIPSHLRAIRTPDHATYCRSALNKSGWLKAAAARALWPCMVIDLDAFVIGSLEGLALMKTPISLGRDASTRSYPTWPEASPELNSGVLLVNDARVADLYFTIWRQKVKEFGHIAMFDQLIWSAIQRTLNGSTYAPEFNWSHWWPLGPELPKVHHFHGQSKLSHF